jgi:hypothetical protein
MLFFVRDIILLGVVPICLAVQIMVHFALCATTFLALSS